jgi:hypothetical protein
MPCKGRRKDGPGSAAGTLWVQALVAKYGRQHMAAIGRLGAQALLDRHGCEHMPGTLWVRAGWLLESHAPLRARTNPPDPVE